MTASIDLSMGQRLAIGFGAVLLVVAVLLVLVFRWHDDSLRAESAYSDRIAPLIERGYAVERDVLRVAINLRALALNPSDERVQALRGSSSAARSAVATLGASTMEDDGRQLYAALAQAADDYLRLADGIAGPAADGDVDAAAEIELGSAREALLTYVGEFRALQEQKAAAALDEIAVVRERTSTSLVAMAVLTAAILTIFALLTTRSVSGPTQALLRTAGAMSAGDWQPALALAPPAGADDASPRNEFKRLANAFGSAAVALERREQRLRADRLVARAVASSLDRHELCERVLRPVVAHLGAEAAVVYCARDDKLLHPVASCALTDPRPVAIGDGIPGQAARDRSTVVATTSLSATELSATFGYEGEPPRGIVALPLLFQHELVGALLVASLRPIGSDELKFLEASATQLGIGLQHVAAHEETKRLLGEVQESYERIQAQNEELQVQNEEIQSQNEEIQTQSEELQGQHEEIQAQNEQLLQQSEELRRHVAHLAEADAHKNHFLGVLAHELRNPMTPITNSVYILRQAEPGSDSAKRAQAIIERQITHLVRLVDDLLDVTRVSEGKIHVQRQPLDLIELARTCVEDSQAAFDQMGIRLEVDIPGVPVLVNGDRTRLSQVLGNLLNNSMKFSERGHVQLSLRVDQESGEAVLRVVDDGVGMESTLLPKLFQPFSQGISGLARVNGGLGLGLALVKALVTLHGGKVAAHSDGPGRGAEFTVRLPLAEPSAAQERDHAVPLRRGNGVPHARRVLVIEDNVDAAESLREALELDGYEVTLAHSGGDGLEAAMSFRPDVVLCDVGLPGIDGYEVARRLRADPNARSLILIALTGYASAADKELARNAGFDLHLAKPLKVTRFSETLEELARVPR